MRLEIQTRPYNQRSYSKPWIAVVNFQNTPKGEFAWGTWVGDHYNGSNGLLVIEANENDIVATGQKDFRQSKNSAPEYYQVREGELVYLPGGKAEAYRLATAAN